MTETMVERVARAIAENLPPPYALDIVWRATSGAAEFDLEQADPDSRQQWMTLACAAIEAMREPTNDMGHAGFVADAFRTPMARLEADFEPKAVYRAMIDAALTPSPMERDK